MANTIRITEAQMSAFECAGVFECDDPLAEFIRADAIQDTDRSRELVNELSNHLDDLSRVDPDDERRKWYGKDARVTANLFSKMTRSEAA